MLMVLLTLWPSSRSLIVIIAAAGVAPMIKAFYCCAPAMLGRSGLESSAIVMSRIASSDGRAYRLPCASSYDRAPSRFSAS